MTPDKDKDKDKEPYHPEEHFISLKGGLAYLPVAQRIVWFRQDHPDGSITTRLLEHDAAAGLAVFSAEVSYPGADGQRSPVASGHGSETRKDFPDYLEKSETKSVGRALAMLGYGTAHALELDEGSRIVDSPIAPRQQPQDTSEDTGQTPPAPQTTRRGGLAVVPTTVALDDLRAAVRRGLEKYPEASKRLPKGPDRMTDAECRATIEWLKRYDASVKERQTAALDAGPPPEPAGTMNDALTPNDTLSVVQVARGLVLEYGSTTAAHLSLSDIRKLQTVISALQRIDPRPGMDVSDVSTIKPGSLLGVIRVRLAALAADAEDDLDLKTAEEDEDEEEDGEEKDEEDDEEEGRTVLDDIPF